MVLGLVEQVMFFALGFLVAGLLTLFFLPIFRRRAIRLATRRLEMQMPLSMAEIIANRDQVRAEAAVAQRRIEQRAETVAADHAAGMAALGRQALVLVEREAALAAMTTKAGELGASLAASEAAHADASAQLGALHQAHWGAIGMIEAQATTIAALDGQVDFLRAGLEETRVTAAALDLQVTALTAQLSTSDRDLRAARNAATDAELAHAKLADEATELRADLRGARARRDTLEAALEAARSSLATKQESLDVAQRAHLRLEAQASAQAKLLAEADARDAERSLAHERQLEALHGDHRKLLRRLETLSVERAELEGALTAARSRASLPAALPQAPRAEAGADELAILRRAISAVGKDVIRLAETLGRQVQPEATEVAAMAETPLQPAAASNLSP